MCMWLARSSMCRNDASSGLIRSMAGSPAWGGATACESGRRALLDHHRVQRRPRRVGDVERLRGDEELIAPVLRAGLRQALEVPDLAEREPEVPGQPRVHRVDVLVGLLERL